MQPSKNNSMSLPIAIPQIISIGSKNYGIICIIEFIGRPGYLGHYVAYVKRSNNTWESYDDQKRARVATQIDNMILIPHIIFYTK